MAKQPKPTFFYKAKTLQKERKSRRQAAMRFQRWIPLVDVFLFALSFILAKFVYLAQPFWSGFIWMRIGGFLVVLCFLFSKEVREGLFKKQVGLKLKTMVLFLGNQGVAAGGFVLQNWGIALAPLVFLPFVNALEGTKYLFVLIFAVLISVKFPQLLREEVSRRVILQKVVAILLIVSGLFLLASSL